jgi:hypothetical protein
MVMVRVCTLFKEGHHRRVLHIWSVYAFVCLFVYLFACLSACVCLCLCVCGGLTCASIALVIGSFALVMIVVVIGSLALVISESFVAIFCSECVMV